MQEGKGIVKSGTCMNFGKDAEFWINRNVGVSCFFVFLTMKPSKISQMTSELICLVGISLTISFKRGIINNFGNTLNNSINKVISIIILIFNLVNITILITKK